MHLQMSCLDAQLTSSREAPRDTLSREYGSSLDAAATVQDLLRGFLQKLHSAAALLPSSRWSGLSPRAARVRRLPSALPGL